MVLNRRDASQYRDLETISPGLRTLKKSEKSIKSFSHIKRHDKKFTGTIDHKTNIHLDTRLQNFFFYRDMNQKRLRTTDLDHRSSKWLTKTVPSSSLAAAPSSPHGQTTIRLELRFEPSTFFGFDTASNFEVMPFQGKNVFLLLSNFMLVRSRT